MKVFLHPFDSSGNSLKEQGYEVVTIDCKNYQYSNKYTFAKRVVKEGLSLNGKVKSYKVFNSKGECLETIGEKVCITFQK